MKRLIVLAVLCAFVLSAAVASAAEIKAVAEFKADAVWQTNWDFVDDTDDEGSTTKTFGIEQRFEVTFDFIANEDLKAVLTLRSGSDAWGDDDTGLTETGSLAVRKAYLDFNWPGTEVNFKIGQQGIALPSAVGGSMLLDDRSSAFLVSSPFTENLSMTAGFIRVDDAGAAQNGFDGQIDLYLLSADIKAGDMNFQPFVVIGNIGDNADGFSDSMKSLNSTGGEVDSAYWLGLSSTMAFGDINVAADINYGAINGDDEIDDRSGWAFLISAEYTALDWFTPEAYFVYTSGEDDDISDGSERMPGVAPDWAIGSFFFGGDAWLEGSIDGDENANYGFWALGVTLKDIQSFTDNLYHFATIIYARGTNDEDAVNSTLTNPLTYGNALTEDDGMIEIDFNTYYDVYDALTIGVELGYIHLDADDDAWGGDRDGGSAYKIATGLKYKF